MSRSSSPLLLLLTLTVGVALGLVLERGRPSIIAQTSRPAARSDLSSSAPAPDAAVAEKSAKAAGESDLYRQLDRQYELYRQVDQTFELVSRAVSPSVVHIVATKVSRGEESSRTRHFEESGSGVIVRGDRGRNLYVLTNNHVIEGAQPAKITIFLHDGRALHPDRYWPDAKADIAVLNLGRDDLPAARLGNSDEASVGSWVLALGSPFGLMHSVSQGIISARSRHMDELQDVENQDFLQTDAAINPGNSGGPLVNMKGEVIGINNSIASNGGGNEGVGFSIPINLARWVMNELLAHGHVSRGALGIDLHPNFRPEDALSMGLERPHGAWIDKVYPGSPAAVGGLQNGDVVLRFNGVEISDLNQLINVVSMAPIGHAAEVVVWRGGKPFSVKVMVGERDRTIATVTPAERSTPSGLLRRPNSTSSFVHGLELVTLDVASSRRLGLPESLRGAAVLKVAPESPLAAVFKPLDVIHSVDGRSVASAEEASQAMSRSTDAQSLVLGFDRIVKGTIERRTIRVP
jgi:serine protease Do